MSEIVLKVAAKVVIVGGGCWYCLSAKELLQTKGNKHENDVSMLFQSPPNSITDGGVWKCK